jgi:hypothetical protein
MLFSLEMAKLVPPCIVVVHDCQVVDAELQPEVFDTVCNLTAKPNRVTEAGFLPERPVPKSICDILLDRLQPNMLDEIPLFRELQVLEHLRNGDHIEGFLTGIIHCSYVFRQTTSPHIILTQPSSF